MQKIQLSQESYPAIIIFDEYHDLKPLQQKWILIVPLLAVLTPLLMGLVLGLAIGTKNFMTTHETWFDSWPSTPLMVASYFGNYMIAEEIVIMLLESDADSNARNAFGDTALHFAACNDNPKVVEILLHHKGVLLFY